MTLRLFPGIAQIARCFEGLDLVEPGVVVTSQWRPDALVNGGPAQVDAICGVGREQGV